MSEDDVEARDLVFDMHQRIQELLKILDTDVRDTEKIKQALDEIEDEDREIFQNFRDVDEWLSSEFTEDFGNLNEERMNALKENILGERNFQGGHANNLESAADMLEEEAERIREEAEGVRELTNQVQEDIRKIQSLRH